MKWSKEIWTFIDCELNSSYGRQKTSKDTPLSDDEMTKLFCLSVKAGNNTIVQSNSYGSLMLGGKPSALFILVILDMYQHPENWIQYQINPELLSERFKDYYKGEIASIYSDIKENPLLIQLLKCQLSYYLNEEMEGGYKEAYIKRQRKALFDIIDRNKISILSKLEFKKIIKPASDLVKMTIKPSEENLAEIKGVSSSTFVLVGNEFFYIDKRQEICKQIPVNSTQVESLVKLFKEGEEVRKLTPEEKKKIEAITGFAQPSEKGENCLTLTYAGKRLEKDMLANILYNDYAARYPDHREKARKKYVYAITELHCSPSEAEGEAANYAAKKEVSSTIGTLFCQPVVAAEGVTKIAEAIPETTFGYGT